MKALSIMQPWPDAIFFLGKGVENRTWATKHRGSLAVHCGKGWDKDGELFIKKNFPDWDNRRAKQMRGGFFGLIWVDACVPVDDRLKSLDKWAFGPYCWILGDGEETSGPAVLKVPVLANGQLGLFNTPAIFDLEINRVKK